MEQFRKVNKKKQTAQDTHQSSTTNEEKNASIIVRHRQMDPQVAGTQTPNLALRYQQMNTS
jgi:hypothetical protein